MKDSQKQIVKPWIQSDRREQREHARPENTRFTFYNAKRCGINIDVFRSYLEKHHTECTPDNISKSAIVIRCLSHLNIWKYSSRSVRKQWLRAVEANILIPMPFSLSIVCPWSVVSCYGTVRLSIRHDWSWKTTRKIQLSFPSENEQQVYRTLWCYHTATPHQQPYDIFTYFVAACCSMHFQCLNGAFQLVSPPMRTVVGKPYVSPKAFSVSRRLRWSQYAQFFTLDHSATTSSLTDFPCPVVAKFQL
jgi:hypothetical protein